MSGAGGGGDARGGGPGRNREVEWPGAATGDDPAQVAAAERLVDRVLAEEAAGPGAGGPPPGAAARVWGRIEEARGRPAWRRLALPAGAAVAAAALVLLVLVARAPSKPAAARPLVADAVREVAVPGVAQLVLAPGTRGELADLGARGVEVTLRRGSLLAEVEHRPPGAPFVVRTPRSRVEVVGTLLWVEVADDGGATVLVGRGAVEVREVRADPGLPTPATRVSAGERWPAVSRAGPSAAQLAPLGGLVAGAVFAPPAPAPPAAPTPEGDACSRLAAEAAIACYRALADAPGSEPLRAESALYAMGWRQLRDLDDPRAALATWSRQRERFPGGALRSEADVSILQAAVRLGDRARARDEAQAWLAAHPQALGAPEVHFLLATVERAEGHCQAALPHFEAALAAPAPAWADQARAQRAACVEAMARSGPRGRPR